MSKQIVFGLAVVVGWYALWPTRNAPGPGSFSKQSIEIASPKKASAPAKRSISAINSAPTENGKTIDIDGYRAEIQTLMGCYEFDCGIGESDAKGPYFEIGRRIKKQLDKLAADVIASGRAEPQISALARENLENSDGHVKEASLKIFKIQPVSAENLNAILQFVILDTDPELITAGLDELKRYSGGQYEEQILSALRESILHGSPFVGLEIAVEIKKVMNARNVGFFRVMAQEIEAGSRIKIELEKSLADFS